MTVDVARALEPLRAIAPQLSRYAAVSALALGLDFAVFLALNSAIGGLALTAAVIAVATGMGVSPILAKVMAAGASFLGVYAIRRTIVFA